MEARMKSPGIVLDVVEPFNRINVTTCQPAGTRG